MSESQGWASPSGGGGSARKQQSVRTSSSAPPTPSRDETADRTAVVSAQLKRIYKKAVLPVEKRYKYDYFYDSPLLTDVEFDGRFFLVGLELGHIAIYFLSCVAFVSRCTVFFCSQTAGSLGRAVQCWKDIFYSVSPRTRLNISTGDFNVFSNLKNPFPCSSAHQWTRGTHDSRKCTFRSSRFALSWARGKIH